MNKKYTLVAIAVSLTLIAQNAIKPEPAKAGIGGDWGFVTDAYNSVMNHTLRRNFTQTFIRSYDLNYFKNKYGQQAETEVWYKCKGAVANEGEYVGYMVPVVREENGNYSCYRRSFTWQD
jgi:hypothetical protein